MSNLWEYRGLIKKLAVTDLKIRYKNSVLGIIWSLLQPLLMFLVLYVVFSTIFANALVPDYPLYLLLGIISWGFLEKATSFSLNSIVGKPNLVKKIYFPREVLVISSCLTALMMTMLELVVFAVYMLVYGKIPTMLALLFPLVLLVEFVFVLGISLAIASLNVRFRDIQWIWAVVMQAAFFMTPIMYSISVLDKAPFASVLKYNPMGVIMEMLRGSLIYDTIPSAASIAYILVLSIALLILGEAIFRKMEPTFAEEV